MHADHRCVEVVETFALDVVHNLRADATEFPTFLDDYRAIRLLSTEVAIASTSIGRMVRRSSTSTFTPCFAS